MAYRTIPIELLEVAERSETYFRGMGFTIAVEETEVGFPRTPAFVARRGTSKHIVEIASNIPSSICDDWKFYAKSCTSDTRIVFCVPPGQKKFEAMLQRIREKNMGLYVVSDNSVDEICAAHDLTVTINPPPLNALPQRIRVKLGPAYEKFSHGHWQEGFEDVCQIYEQQSREYLTRKVMAGHINIVGRGGAVRNPSRQQLGRMTAGSLAKAYAAIQYPSPDTALIGQTLTAINKDRNAVVHNKGKRATEERLRRNVNGNIWKVVNGLRKFPR